ncbi:hypothetical protein [Methylomicrobium agile]|uniref:hypothetical protein n=1 Tax=Methylomicrobium agile TaxID=39774 RepID=UPI0004DF062E|nr:hypothetical protein [Methylomicrobium agile]
MAWHTRLIDDAEEPAFVAGAAWLAAFWVHCLLDAPATSLKKRRLEIATFLPSLTAIHFGFPNEALIKSLHLPELVEGLFKLKIDRL